MMFDVSCHSLASLLVDERKLVRYFADRLANGITLGGFKFMAIKAESDEVIGRKGVSASYPVNPLRSNPC